MKKFNLIDLFLTGIEGDRAFIGRFRVYPQTRIAIKNKYCPGIVTLDFYDEGMTDSYIVGMEVVEPCIKRTLQDFYGTDDFNNNKPLKVSG